MEWFTDESALNHFPAGIYRLRVNNRNTRTRCEICTKLTIKVSVIIVNFKHITPCSSVSVVNFEHVIAVGFSTRKHCPKFSTSQIFATLQAGFAHALTLLNDVK